MQKKQLKMPTKSVEAWAYGKEKSIYAQKLADSLKIVRKLGKNAQ